MVEDYIEDVSNVNTFKNFFFLNNIHSFIKMCEYQETKHQNLSNN